MPEVAALPVRELRLPLLAPSELVTLESYNQQDLLIPVSCSSLGLLTDLQGWALQDVLRRTTV